MKDAMKEAKYVWDKTTWDSDRAGKNLKTVLKNSLSTIEVGYFTSVFVDELCCDCHRKCN